MDRTVAVEGGAVRLIANHFDIFDAKTPGVTVADNIGTVRAANHLSAETAIKIVDTLDLAVSRLLHHTHFGAFIRVISRLRGTILTVGARLADLVAFWVRLVNHVL